MHYRHFGSEVLLAEIEARIDVRFFQDLLSGLETVYERAHDHVVATFGQPEAHDILAVIRRAFFESELRNVAFRHGLNAEVRKNKRRTSNHTEVQTFIGEIPVVITAVSSGNFMDLQRVRSAEFRKTLAETAQLHLFKENKPAGDAYYAVINHGAHPANPRKLNFAYLGFPTADCTQWYGNYCLDLLAGRGDTIEAIKDTTNIRLKPQTSAEE